VQDDPVLAPIVDEAPGTTRVCKAALQLPMLGAAAKGFEGIDLRAILVSSVSSRWSQSAMLPKRQSEFQVPGCRSVAARSTESNANLGVAGAILPAPLLNLAAVRA
jgi:hypothetical protein